tara:strand:- start:2589 stop:7667 length:5079 start_codon:yes stop_codon:yes gene_type:complete
MSFNKKLEQKYSSLIDKLENIQAGDYSIFIGQRPTESYLTESGYAVFLEANKAKSITPKTRTITSMSPEATILVKKKAFSTLGGYNDLRFMDKTEKMLLRATKALFAYKVAQIRAYESLTKFENHFDQYKEIHMGLLAEVLDQTKYMVSGAQGTLSDKEASELNRLRFTIYYEWQQKIGSGQGLTIAEQEQYEKDKARFDQLSKKANNTSEISDYSSFGSAFNSFSTLINGTLEDLDYEAYRDDVLDIIKRNAFSIDSRLTTWIIDPDSEDNYGVGPGTGVIEITTFSNFSTNCSIGQGSINSASIQIEDPYRVMTVNDDDIEIAIEEALNGTVGLFNDLFNGDFNTPILDTSSMISAALQQGGLGGMDDSLDIDRVRDRLRTFYLGKPFINPADGVHFYIRGNKTKQDDSDSFGSVWSSRTGEDSSFDDSYLAVDNAVLEAERRLYTSGKIDFESYKKIRTYSDNSFGMIHVFGGYVTDTSESYGNGKWTLSISCSDNMGWLDWSKYAENPALQDAKGILEDPLTPYKLKVDESGRVMSEEGPELLNENKTLLQSGLLSYGSGLLAGKTATEGNLIQGQFSGSGSLYGAGILQHPNGFVYRWKDGIITATTEVTVIDERSTSVTNTRTFNQGYALSATDTPLSNLDVANILSLLVVGEPYNVQSYMEQTLEAMTRNETSGTSLNPSDPLTAIIETTRRQNTFYGNFKPYRRITMSNDVANKISMDSIMRSQVNSSIATLQARRAELRAQRARILTVDESEISPNPESVASSILANSLDVEIDSIGKGIEEQLALINEQGVISSPEGLYISFNLDGSPKLVNLSEDMNEDPSFTKAVSLVGAQRRIEDVRLNRDKNLFIISDQYDASTDIRPFLLKLRNSSWNLFDASYASVLERCKAACSYINFEFFCNSQGHIEFRPPQWNKTPLSVLEGLFKLNKERKVIPDFLTNVFNTRTDSLRLEIHSLNINIVIISLLLNKYPDKTLIPGITGAVRPVNSGKKALEFFGVRLNDGVVTLGGPTSGISQALFGEGEKANFTVGGEREQGSGSGISLNVSWSDDGDVLYGDTETVLGDFDPVFQETTLGGAGIGVYDGVLRAVNLGTQPVNNDEIVSASSLTALRNTFRKNYGLDPAAGLGVGEQGFQDSDFVKNLESDLQKLNKVNLLFQKLATTISKRDSLVTVLKRNQEKLQEIEQIESIISGEFTDASSSGNEPDFEVEVFGINLNDTLDKVQNLKSLLNGDIDSESSSSLDYLIENDQRNYLGPGSGRRFIVNDDEIISVTFTESPPDFTRVDVFGSAPLGLEDSLNKGMDGMYFWAGATDFDLWRQYGYKPGTLRLPFSNDAELQSRPYSILQLQLERTKINKASLTVPGNEFYQPGDVVFLPEKGLLYYIDNVQHQFSYGSSFQTTMSLTYGHPPGQYLPSPLDVIGGQLTTNPLGGRILTYRGQREDDLYRVLTPDCAIVFPPNYNGDVATLLAYRNNQERFFNMMLDLSASVLGSRKILIRGFARNEGEESKVKDNLAIIKQLLQDPVQITQTSPVGDLADVFGNMLNGVGAGVGTSKGTTPLILPNGLQATPIDPSNIIEQITLLTGRSDEFGEAKILCMDRVLYGSHSLDEEGSSMVQFGSDSQSPYTEQDYVAIFPKDGPRQSSWLDIRDNLTQMSNIIEIGILNIPSTPQSSQSSGTGSSSIIT